MLRVQRGKKPNTNGDRINRLDPYRYAGFLCAALAPFVPGSLQAQENPTTLPPVHIEAPQSRPAPRQASTTAAAAKRRTARVNHPPKPAAQTASAPDDGNGPNNNNSGPPLQQAPSLGKTGTPLADLPATVQIIPREVLVEQGVQTLKDSINNASGITYG